MVVPSLSTLLTYSSWESLSDLRPIPSSIFGHLFLKRSIFFLTPRSLNKSRIQHLLPPMKALNISSVVKMTGDVLPVASSVLLD